MGARIGQIRTERFCKTLGQATLRTTGLATFKMAVPRRKANSCPSRSHAVSLMLLALWPAAGVTYVARVPFLRLLHDLTCVKSTSHACVRTSVAPAGPGTRCRALMKSKVCNFEAYYYATMGQGL